MFSTRSFTRRRVTISHSEEHEPAAVERRDGEQVQDREHDGDRPDEREERLGALPRAAHELLRDADGPGELRALLAREEAAERGELGARLRRSSARTPSTTAPRRPAADDDVRACAKPTRPSVAAA